MKPVLSHPAPIWLTQNYLESVMRHYKRNKFLQIIEIEIKPATAKGENYASVMTRIKVTYTMDNSETVNQESYIVKTSYESDPFVANLFGSYDIYNTEMIMYEKILPELTQILTELGSTEKLFASTVHVDYEHSAIIFEDLAVSQFSVADRLVGLNKNQAKIALKKLAQMHASAAVFNERSPGILTKFDHGLFNRYTKGLGFFFESMIEVCANFAGTCDKLGLYYKEKLLKLKSRVVEYATRVYDPHEGYFQTMNHGDFWVNNIMIQFDKDFSINQCNIKDLLIIDFQFSCWGSPAIDLHYFLNTSLENSDRINCQDELIQYYYQILEETLNNLRFSKKIPTLHEFCVQIEDTRFYAVVSSLVSQSLMINDQTDDADFNRLVEDNERGRNFRNLIYENKIVQDNAQYLLPYFDRKGLLDVYD